MNDGSPTDSATCCLDEACAATDIGPMSFGASQRYTSQAAEYMLAAGKVPTAA